MKVGDADSLNDLNDEQLVELCRENNVEAANALINRFAPSVFKRASAYSPSMCEDLAQEGFLALLDAVRTYSHEKGAAFGTYAQLCIRNRMINVCKRSQTDFDELPEDNNDRPDDPSAIPENIVMQQASVDELYGMLNNELSELELKVLRYYASGMQYSQIADKLGVSKKTVDNAVQRMRKKVRDLLG